MMINTIHCVQGVEDAHLVPLINIGYTASLAPYSTLPGRTAPTVIT
ncbi:hypothetical protein [Streptomyces sp. Ru62]|nr:hypothetical protein [Streptomyces sp. Ru62]